MYKIQTVPVKYTSGPHPLRYLCMTSSSVCPNLSFSWGCGLASKATTCDADIPYGHSFKSHVARFQSSSILMAWETAEPAPGIWASAIHDVEPEEVPGF